MRVLAVEVVDSGLTVRNMAGGLAVALRPPAVEVTLGVVDDDNVNLVAARYRCAPGAAPQAGDIVEVDLTVLGNTD
jgi:hypothetical protein